MRKIIKKREKSEIKTELLIEEEKISISYADVSNIGAREGQQDCFGRSDFSDSELISNKGVLVIVADGMGGLNDGDVSSRLIVEMFLGYFNTVDFEGQPSLELLRMVREANRTVLENNTKTNSQSGSTVIAVNIVENKLYFVSVGDSHIYLQRGGNLILLNREHTYAAELDDMAAKGIISAEAAYKDPQRKSLTSYVGIEELTLIDNNSKPIELMKGDQVVLATDGVFGTLTDEEILRCICGADATNQGKNIENAILNKGKAGQDNFTAIVLTIG